MKSRFILELDMLAPIKKNLEWLDKCEAAIKEKRKQLKAMAKNKKVKNQLTIEDESARADND